MKKGGKTEEETKRDLLVIEVRNAKISVENAIIKINTAYLIPPSAA